ncbi:sensor domain-containing diguanylate cyclase [Cereibacter sphaeroides]|uniref:sensor domain-containing diguanylate cyclase n=1 Tax=Cereibacter sphaeroides TaxID=1063 RepID=UPI001F46C1EF|nr:sensor domain-containing diguanylate cyclase [Cereibacter sphaeroides]MCE6949901.1 sensor domain-containing diguanylate cyclase [Cereibacter sphaeroides]
MPPSTTCRPRMPAEKELQRIAALRQYQILDTLPDKEFDMITQTVKHVFDVPMVAISFVDTHRQWFKSEIGMGVCETDRAGSFCTHTIEGPDPMAIPDALEDPHFRSSPLVSGPPRIRAYLGAPLASPEGCNLGAICVMDHVPRQFSRRDRDVLAHFANLIMERLELRRAVAEDVLTGACTRRAFEERFAAAMRQHQRSGSDLTLALFDIDDFKAFNDSYGHPAGDRVLRSVGRCTRSTIRRSDIFGRVGGDEFAIVLPDTSLAEAEELLRRLRKRFAAIRLAEAPDVVVTASFGLAGALDPEVSPRSLMKITDKALYAAKASGKNAICLQDQERPLTPPRASLQRRIDRD